MVYYGWFVYEIRRIFRAICQKKSSEEEEGESTSNNQPNKKKTWAYTTNPKLGGSVLWS